MRHTVTLKIDGCKYHWSGDSEKEVLSLALSHCLQRGWKPHEVEAEPPLDTHTFRELLRTDIERQRELETLILPAGFADKARGTS